ncbi:hypothetical protein JRQ81_011311 [Phrynocephalus forsythii]|uniref:Uncharacterized protein n=1 Tax=Phrynocephalus forsythii TaxID=171643 RepID=A0A9Q0X9Q3_9SAUR|nr:hypothetical protein JRQ81_011311 [Phrynocephalus forsythii]
MAHSGRWRFPARPGSGGWGRRGLGGCRLRVPALRSLRGEAARPRPPANNAPDRGAAAAGGGGGGPAGQEEAPAAAAAAGSGGGGGAAAGAPPSSAASPPPPSAAPAPAASTSSSCPAGGPPSSSSAACPSSSSSSSSSSSAGAAVVPGFDAALQVSAAIGINLRRFRAACGAEAGSGEDEQFLGFGSEDEEAKCRSPATPPTAKAGARKPRGRPRNSSDRSSLVLSESWPLDSSSSQTEAPSLDRVTKKGLKNGEKRRGRPPALGSVKFKVTHPEGAQDAQKGGKEEKENVKKIRRAPSTAFQHADKIKKLRAGKLSPLKSQFKAGKLHLGRKGAQMERRRGRPPSAERASKVSPNIAASAQLEKAQRARKEKEGVPPLPKEEKPLLYDRAPAGQSGCSRPPSGPTRPSPGSCCSGPGRGPRRRWSRRPPSGRGGLNSRTSGSSSCLW